MNRRARRRSGASGGLVDVATVIFCSAGGGLARRRRDWRSMSPGRDESTVAIGGAAALFWSSRGRARRSLSFLVVALVAVVDADVPRPWRSVGRAGWLWWGRGGLVAVWGGSGRAGRADVPEGGGGRAIGPR